MRAVTVTGRIPTKTVRVEDVTPDDSDEDILEVALDFAGETRSSLFGWTVYRFDSVASVALHTD
jgi:hypothetical protein